MKTFYNKIEYSFPFTVLVLVIMTAAAYISIILKVPQFIADDYYIFHVIQSNRSSVVTMDFYEKYSLVLRPVLYFYLWIQNHLFGSHSLLIKMSSLVLLLIYSAGVVIALKYILIFFKVPLSNLLLLLGGFFIILHPDTVISVLWISDVNELLMSLFYVLAVIVFFAFNNDDIRSPILGSSLLLMCYLLSLFSKQQSMHLPLLFLFILMTYKSRFENKKYRHWTKKALRRARKGGEKMAGEKPFDGQYPFFRKKASRAFRE